MGELEDASVAFTAAPALASEHAHLLLLACATNNLGMIATQRGQHERVLGRFDEADAAVRERFPSIPRER